MIVILFPALVAVVGALVYALSANPRVQMLALIAYACGLFWTVNVLIGHTSKLLP